MGNIVGRLKSLIPYDRLQLIIGSVMGDARLRIHQSDKQKDYVFWKYEQLKNLVLRGPRFTKVWHDPLRDKDHFSWYFHTQSSETLGLIHKLFYQEKIKIVPKELINIIDPLGLAIWYMDDGSNNGNNVTLNTHSFSVDEQKVLQNLLRSKFGVITSMVKDRSKFKIAIGFHEYDKFMNIVRPYVIPSMNYKISSPRNDLLQKMRQVAIF